MEGDTGKEARKMVKEKRETAIITMEGGSSKRTLKNPNLLYENVTAQQSKSNVNIIHSGVEVIERINRLVLLN